MRLFHFTTEPCWAAISSDLEIISLLQKNERYGVSAKLFLGDQEAYRVRPDLKHTNDVIDGVVWLTSNAYRRQQWMIGAFTNDPREKGAIRIEVDVPDAQQWPGYAVRAMVDPQMRRGLDETGGGEERMWYVVERVIPASEWVEVVRTSDGLVLWRREEAA